MKRDDCIQCEPTRPSYARSRLAWIKRRARRLMRLDAISRRLAILDAWGDYVLFTGDRSAPPALSVVTGGRS